MPFVVICQQKAFLEVYVKRIFSFLLLFVFFFSYLRLPMAENNQVLFQPAKVGDNNENVQRIQEKLIQLNYLNSNPTGKYLEQTKEAVKQFQLDNGLEGTGIVDESTAKKLAEISFRPIEPGSQSKAVVLIQERLIELGYLNAKATGNYKTQTEKAIQNFQKR